MSKKPKRPRDPNQLAKFTLDITIGKEELPESQSDGKNPAAVTLGRLGGLKGGKARAISLSVKQRKDIAKKAAKVRWKDKKDGY